METLTKPLEVYQELLARIDRFFQHAAARYPEQIRCGPGCDDCCQRDLSLFPVEVERLVEAAASLPKDVLQRVLERAARAAADPEAPCALLEEGLCLAYPSRPVICRTHGLPLLLDGPRSRPSLSVCPCNFQQLGRIAGDCVLDLSPVNKMLATVNHLVCSARAISPERLSVSSTLLERLAKPERSPRSKSKEECF